MFPQPAQPMPGNAPPPAVPQAPGAPMAGGGAPANPGAPPQSPPLSPAAQQYMHAMEQWQQQMQQVQAIQQANQKKQAEFAAACQLIREDGVHGFKIDIETDSTIAPDEQAEKAARTEFLKEFVPLVQLLGPMAMGNPAFASMAKEIALFGVRGFPTARLLEETIEQAFDTLAKMPPMPSQGAGQIGPGGVQIGHSPSPQELAVKKHGDDVRLQIAREKNAVEMFNAAQDAQADKEKLMASQEKDRTELALKLSTEAHKNALTGARLTHIEARDAGMLS